MIRLAFWYSPAVGFWQIVNEEMYLALRKALPQNLDLYEGCALCLAELTPEDAQSLDIALIQPHPALHAQHEQHYDGPHS